MKRIQAIITVLIIIVSAFCFKITANDTTYISKRYNGGEKALQKFILSNQRYPAQALNNCVVGTSLSSLKINSAGEIVDIKIINSLGSDIDNEVMMVLRATKGRWLKDEKNIHDTVFYFQIVFKVKGTDFFKPKIATENLQDEMAVIGYGNQYCRFIQDEKLIEMINSTYNKSAYKKLLSLLNEAIRRNPFHKQFYELRIQCYKNLNLNKNLILEDSLKITRLIGHKTIEEIVVK